MSQADQVALALAYMKRLRIKGGPTTAVLVSAALDRRIEVSADRQPRALLQFQGRSFYFLSGRTNLNHPLAKRCARQKEVASRLLQDRGVLTPENCYFRPDDAKRAWAWAKPILPVVVKPHNSTHGRGVHMNIESRRQFFRAFAAIASTFGGLLVETQASGTEHRVLVVDGRVVAATRRVPANVVGDGRSTVRELIELKNQDRIRRGDRTHKKLTIDDIVISHLKAQSLRIDTVVDEGVQIFLRPTSNLHTGGDAIDATDELAYDEVELAERAVTAIPGLRLAGLDLLLPRNGTSSQPLVLEVNTSPMISMHHFPWVGKERDVAGAIVDAMFPPTARLDRDLSTRTLST